MIKGEIVERAQLYKYLGITSDDKMSWKCYIDVVVMKVHSRLYCLRKLSSLHVSEEILQMFYTPTISSVLTFEMTFLGWECIQTREEEKDSTGTSRMQVG